MTKKLLVLFLGNSIFADDKIGLVLGEMLKPMLESEGHEVEILEKTGFSLIDHLENRRDAVIVDSVKTGKHKVGEIVTVKPEDFQQYAPLTSHYVGIPEALKMMTQLDLNPPEQVHIFGIEVEDPYTISEEMSQKLTVRLDELSEEIHKNVLSIARGASMRE
ncbi:MAG: hydrogenase maturation protease [Candidatus Bathyarchaeia archaeon]|jgi:hydrogenase maturation protease